MTLVPGDNQGTVLAVSRSADYAFSKANAASIQLVAGHGVAGDVHAGVTVKHRSRIARDPTAPNLRQVHLLQAELLEALRAVAFGVTAGALGENITTAGIDLLGLPTGTCLHLGESAVIEITGLRNPCTQLNQYQPGLMAALLGKDEQGNLVRKAGVMAIVQRSGEVRPGDVVRIAYPPLPHRPLAPV